MRLAQLLSQSDFLMRSVVIKHRAGASHGDGSAAHSFAEAIFFLLRLRVEFNFFYSLSVRQNAPGTSEQIENIKIGHDSSEIIESPMNEDFLSNYSHGAILPGFYNRPPRSENPPLSLFHVEADQIVKAFSDSHFCVVPALASKEQQISLFQTAAHMPEPPVDLFRALGRSQQLPRGHKFLKQQRVIHFDDG